MYDPKTISENFLGKNVTITISNVDKKERYLSGEIKTCNIDSIVFEVNDDTNQTIKLNDISFIQID